MIAAANPNEETPDEKPGGGGALFQRPDNFRSDARLAAQMITLGVVTLEQAQSLLRAGYKLAMKSAKAGRAREYAACMKIGLEVAKLEQNERHKAIDKSLPDIHQHQHTLTPIQSLLDQPDYVEYLRQRTLTADCDAGAICQIREPGYSPPVANGKAHGGTGPGTNGHRNGSK